MDCNAGKESILREIFTAYKESGTAYKKTTDPAIRHKLLAIKHGLDLAIKRLLPIDDDHLQSLNELNAPFSS